MQLVTMVHSVWITALNWHSTVSNVFIIDLQVYDHWEERPTSRVEQGTLFCCYLNYTALQYSRPVAYAENFHRGGWLRVIWWLFAFGVRCLLRHYLTSFTCFQTNVLAKFVDVIMHIFLHPLPLFHVSLHWI